VNHKGRARHFTSPDELEKERKKLENKKWRAKKEDDEEGDSDEEGDDETKEEGAAGGKEKSEGEESSEEESDEGEHKAKGVEGLIEIENPNRIVKKEKKLSKLGMGEPAEAEVAAKPELSRKEREELERQRAKAHYQKMHAEGKTEQARADLARLAIIRKQREEAAAKRDEDRKAKEALTQKKTDETSKALGKKS